MNPKHLVIAAVVLAATSSVISRAHSAGTERVEISSPIFPQTSVLYAQEGAKFPATLAGEEALVHAAALTFEKLLTECAKTDSTITLSTGAPLTSEQLESNYRQVAACAYEKYTVKPYWIPKLIDDVAIKLSIQLIHDLKRLNKKHGLVTACVGRGQGIAAVIEVM